MSEKTSRVPSAHQNTTHTAIQRIIAWCVCLRVTSHHFSQNLTKMGLGGCCSARSMREKKSCSSVKGSTAAGLAGRNWKRRSSVEEGQHGDECERNQSASNVRQMPTAST